MNVFMIEKAAPSNNGWVRRLDPLRRILEQEHGFHVVEYANYLPEGPKSHDALSDLCGEILLTESITSLPPDIRSRFKIVASIFHGVNRWVSDEWLHAGDLSESKRTAQQYTHGIATSGIGLKGLRSFFDLMIPFHVLGFPYDVQAVAPYRIAFNEKKQQIVVNGRLAFEKNPLFVMVLLEPFWAMRVPIVFTSPEDEERTRRFDPNMGLVIDLLRRRGVTVHCNLPPDEYYRVVAESKVCFSASHGDGFNVAIFEAALLDTVPVVPRMPPFDELGLYRFMYEPWSAREARALVHRALDAERPHGIVVAKTQQFDVHVWASEAVAWLRNAL